MRKHIARWTILVVFAVVAVMPFGQVLAQQAEVMVTSPAANSEVSGLVTITGSASTSNFAFYKVEFGAGPNPGSWTLIGSTHDTPIVNGQLETWDTTRLADGDYTLRLQAVKTDGNYDEFYVRGVRISRAVPTATPTIPTPTARPSATPAADGVTPQPTATLQVIAPKESPVFATATPTPVYATMRDTLQLDTEGWKHAFTVGAGAMGVVFVVLGIIFALRRLL